MFVLCLQGYLDVAVVSDSLDLPPGQLVVLGYDAKVAHSSVVSVAISISESKQASITCYMYVQACVPSSPSVRVLAALGKGL